MAADVAVLMETPQDRDEWRDARATRDERSGSLVGDGAPDVAEQQAVARHIREEPLGDAVLAGVEVALDGELEMIPFAERGEGEGMLLVAPALLVKRDIGRLAGLEGKAGGLLELVAANVVGDPLDVDDPDARRHAGSPPNA